MEQFPLRRDFGEGSMKPQVFINFRGDELRHRFVNYLKKALVRNGINTYTDSDEQKGHNLKVFFKRIEDSTIALVIFSSMYTESEWCLDELAKMKECMESTNLVVIPIFYLVAPFTVRNQMGDFGDKFRMLVLKDVDDVRKNMWTEALKSIAENTGIEYDGKRDEDLLIEDIVKEVKTKLTVTAFPQLILSYLYFINNPVCTTVKRSRV